MPRAEGYKQFISPNEGLITEQTILSPVENSTTDELNMTFSPNGSKRVRRLGLAAEEGSEPLAFPTALRTDSALSYSLWKSVGGIGGLDYHVFQIDHILYLIADSSGAIGVNATAVLTYDLNDNIAPAYTDTSDTPVDMASGEGLLFVTGMKVAPFFLEYDETAGTISGTQIELRVRDMVGVDDSLEIDERPSTLSDEHDYNLNNQGWWQQRRETDGGADQDPIALFFTNESVYPSNADIAYLGMVDDGSGNLIFSTEELTLLTIGNTPAPKGHFIIDPFNIDYDNLRTGANTGGGGWGLLAPIPGDSETINTRPTPIWYNTPDWDTP